MNTLAADARDNLVFTGGWRFSSLMAALLLAVSAGATLNFADSSAETWPKSIKVAVEGFAENAIRFSGPVPRRMMFKLDDVTPLYVNNDGYVTTDLPGAVLVIR